MSKINRWNDRLKETITFSSKSYADVITYEKIHLHLRDINDVISEADIQNVRTDMHAFVANQAGGKERAVLIEMLKDLDADKANRAII